MTVKQLIEKLENLPEEFAFAEVVHLDDGIYVPVEAIMAGWKGHYLHITTKEEEAELSLQPTGRPNELKYQFVKQVGLS